MKIEESNYRKIRTALEKANSDVAFLDFQLYKLENPLYVLTPEEKRLIKVKKAALKKAEEDLTILKKEERIAWKSLMSSLSIKKSDK